MKKFTIIFTGVLFIATMSLFGCSDGSNSPTSVVLNTAKGGIEGQIVTESGMEFAKMGTNQALYAGSSTVYPVSGAVVELIQGGELIATAITDEYGRFRFLALPAGEYEVRVVADDGSEAHYHAVVNADQTVAVYGRVVSGECLWDEEYGPRWEEMPAGQHWGNGFQGASPGQGYWFDGEQWCEPQGTGPHGPQGGNGGPHR